MANTRKYKYESRVQRLTNRKTVRFSSMREIGLGTLELQRPVGNYNYNLQRDLKSRSKQFFFSDEIQ